jgi:hypothetical protein
MSVFLIHTALLAWRRARRTRTWLHGWGYRELRRALILQIIGVCPWQIEVVSETIVLAKAVALRLRGLSSKTGSKRIV